MAPQKHALLFWEDGNQYSTVSTKVISGFQRDKPDELLGNNVTVEWEGKLCEARLLHVGTKANMKRQANELSKLAAETSFAEKELLEAGGNSPFVEVSSIKEEPATVACIPNQLRNGDFENDVQSNDAAPIVTLTNDTGSRTPNANESYDQLTVEELRTELAKSQALVQEKDFENRKLKRALKRSSVRMDSDCVLESIGSNFNLPKSFLDFLKLSYLGNPTIFLRRLVFDSNLFTLEEIAASSISGKKCPMSDAEARPALDPVRLKAIKDYTVASCGVQQGSLEMEKLLSSMRQIPSDARKKLNKTKKANLSS